MKPKSRAAVCAPSDDLLRSVHDRLGGLGVDIQTFGESDRVEIRWRRSYNGVWSDERFWSAISIEAALRAVLEYEDEADREEADVVGAPTTWEDCICIHGNAVTPGCPHCDPGRALGGAA